MYQVDFRFLCSDRIVHVILLILVLLIRALYLLVFLIEYDSLRIQYFYETFVNNLHK